METNDLVQTDFDERWPSESPEAFWRFSAVSFAKQVKTPLLILHGAADPRALTYQVSNSLRHSPLAGRRSGW